MILDGLREIIKAVCIVSVGIAVVEGLTSGTVLKNQMKFILSLSFITVLLVPVVKGSIGFSISDIEDFLDTGEYEASSELYSRCLEEQINENISKVIMDEFAAAGISCEKLQIDVNISETNSIDINKVTINTGQFEDAAKIIRRNLGEGVIIENEAD